MTLITNLTAYWKLDESSGNASDSVGSNTLTNNNTATYTTGKINNGITLARASTQYLSVADNAAFKFTTDFSVSVWLKVGTAPTAGQQMIIIGKDANGANNTRSYDIAYENSGGTKRFVAYIFGTGYSYPSNYESRSQNYDLGTGTWHLFNFTFTAANSAATQMAFYIDGVLVGNGTHLDGSGTSSVQDSTSALQIGYESFQGAFDGMMDEFGLWSRALTAGEVTALYNNNNALAYPLTALGPIYDNSLLDGSSGSALTVGANSNRVLIAYIINSADNISPVTAVSYNSVSMTLLGSVAYGTLGKLYTYYQFAPSTGSHTFSVTGGSAYNLSAYSYYNTYQGSILNHAEVVGSGNSASNALVPTASNSVIVALVCENMTGGTLTAGTNMANNQHPATHANSVAASVFGDSGLVSSSTTQSASGGTGTVGNAAISQIALAPDTYTTTSIKTIDGLAIASVKTVNGLAIASVKTVNGLA